MSSSPRPFFSLAGIRYGARAALPAVPGFIMFSAAFGTAAGQKGLSLAEAMSLSAFVYAGASQMVSLEIWQKVWTPTTILTVMMVTAVVNARFFLLSATLQPWLRHEPISRTLFNLFFLTEANWLIGTRHHNEGGRDVGVLLGAGLLIWTIWGMSTVLGFFAGALVPEPKRFGLDFVMPVYFGIMLVPLWKGSRNALPWLVAGLVSFITHAFVPGYAYILAGALAGVIAGMLME